MGDEEIDFWTSTIEAFAPLQLDGPVLSPKLLKRPPFRFISDIVTAINARFAAYDHIFRPDQLDPASVDTKEKKIEYLTTLVQYVSFLLGQKVDVNVKKIVSGHEPEKTNVFLQCLALAVGYAQQDKARRLQIPSPQQQEQEALQQQEVEKSQITTTGQETLGVSPDALGSGTDCSEGEHLPKRILNSSVKAGKKEMIIRESSKLYNKIGSYGYFKLDQVQSVKEVGQSIVDMYRDLKQNTTETAPSSLPIDALETAIKRQIEAIQQVDALEEENKSVLEELETLLSS